MHYFIDNGIATDLVKITSDHKEGQQAEMNGLRVQTDHDLGCMAEARAQAYRASNLTGEKWLPVDRGSHVHPRYGVVKAPIVGDPVSKGFNGDYYPQGEVVKVSKSMRRVETSTGEVFWRRGESAGWVASGGTWSMIRGHVDERNPHF